MQCVQKLDLRQSSSFSSEFYINLLLDVILNYIHTARLKNGSIGLWVTENIHKNIYTYPLCTLFNKIH